MCTVLDARADSIQEFGCYPARTVRDRDRLVKTKPFLRWAGSKRKHISLLQESWSPRFDRYIEPFMGSACLFFAIAPRHALLADINPDLVRTFQALRSSPCAVYKGLSAIPRGKHSYYALRKRDSRLLNDAESAARFIFLNRFCFNGLYRTNKMGKFNVPFSPSGTGALPSELDLCMVAGLLQNAQIRCNDFEATLAETRPGDFVYLDPPYAVMNRRVFAQYSASSFGISDLRRLASALGELDRRGVAFLLSYAYCQESIKFFAGWAQRRLFVQRNIAGFSRHRRRAAEILVSNCSFKPHK